MRRFDEKGFALVGEVSSEIWYLDDYLLVGPLESASGNWEVWNCSRELEDIAEKLEDIELIPETKLWEFSAPREVCLEVAHAFLGALSIGYEIGNEAGRKEALAASRFAIDVLAGRTELDPLIEAAEQAGYKAEPSTDE